MISEALVGGPNNVDYTSGVLKSESAANGLPFSCHQTHSRSGRLRQRPCQDFRVMHLLDV
ncbi:MAG: hypothetical protein SAL70_05575 [Scytonema sp. PMC 1070.18]|nr:hypothetical protein [Scytonema sp. PMC 1070.18]